MNHIPKLDVVIVNYNSGHALEKCIETLSASNSSQLNIIVVDNGSQDDSLQAIKYQYDGVNVIENTLNVGFAKACNFAAKIGQAHYLAFINPDCFVSSEQLLQLVKSLENDPSAALVGCRVLNDDGSLQAASRRRPPTLWRVFVHMTHLDFLPGLKGINLKDNGLFDEIQRVEAVNGACMLLKRDAFNAVNGFDEAYPLHFEDLDMFAKLLKANQNILYDSDVAVRHIKGHSSQNEKKIKAWKKQGLLRYFKKHRPHWEYAVIKFILGSR